MANYAYITNLGVVTPDTDTLLSDVEAEYRAALGAPDLVTTPDTPQGALIAAEVEARDSVVRNNVELANQINPDLAGGVFLDAIWALTRGSRRPAQRSLIVGAVLTGQPNTLIPAGSLAAVESTGELFATVSPVVLNDAGTITVDMQSVNFGPIAAPPGDLVNVATSVLGWESVTNPSAAVLGSLEESDASARQRRRLTLALQSVALPEAIISWLYDLDDVHSLSFRENVSNVTAVIDGVTMKPHSIYVCVSGGTDAEVAEVLLRTKSLGAGWNGASVVNIIEPFSGQSYAVQFDRATDVPVFIRVTARMNGVDGASIIPDAIMKYVNGELEGDRGFVVGASISPFEISGAINQVEPRIFVSLVELSTDGINYSSASVPITIQQRAITTENAISVISV